MRLRSRGWTMQTANRSIRRIAPDELIDFLTVLSHANGQSVDGYYVEAWRDAFDYARNIALFLDGRIMGTATSGLVDVTTPGPLVVPAACIGNLAVDSAALVPGLAREIFLHQCRQHREEGFPFIVFSVNEAMRGFHLRLGSAPATGSMRLTLTPGRGGVPADGLAGDIEDLSVFSPALYDVYRRAAATTVGMFVRERSWMGAVRRLSAVPAEPTVWGHRLDRRLRGYAIARRGRPGNGPATLVVDELIADNPATCRFLVNRLLSAGAERVEINNWRVDDPIRWWVEDWATVERGTLRDALWMRLLDVPLALTSRRYSAAGRLTLEVADRFLPEAAGRFTLDASPDGGSCEPTGAPADVRLSTGALAATYFGGTAAGTLLETGLAVAASARAAHRFEALFRASRPPWSGPEW
jgi:predicted acetyltransferase